MNLAVVIPTIYNKKQFLFSKLVKNLISSYEELIPKEKKKLTITFFIYFNELKTNEFLLEERLNKKFLDKKSNLSIKVFSSKINFGFTGAINQVLSVTQKMEFDGYLVINDDTWIKEDFLYLLLKIKEKSLASFLIKKKQNIESFGLNYHHSGLAFPNLDCSKDPKYFCGTAFYVSQKLVKKMFNKFGFFFNPLFFAYAEDLDLSILLRRLGENISFKNDLLVNHVGSRTAKRGSFKQLFFGFRNLNYVLILHWPVEILLKNLFLVILGQCYMILLSLKKGYFLLYPKIIFQILKNIKFILWMRKKYAKECRYPFSF